MNEEANSLDEKLSCLFSELGKEVGTIVRCLIQTEIQNKMQSIAMLQNLLFENDTCNEQ